MALVFAAIVFGLTIVSCLFMIGAEMNRPIPGSGSGIIWTFCSGAVISILLVASHWLPHVGW